MNTFPVRVSTPDGGRYEAVADSVVLPGPRGFFGVQANHARMTAGIAPGTALIRNGNATSYLILGEGFAEIGENRLHLLVDTLLLAASAGDAEQKVEDFLRARRQPPLAHARGTSDE